MNEANSQLNTCPACYGPKPVPLRSKITIVRRTRRGVWPRCCSAEYARSALKLLPAARLGPDRRPPAQDPNL